MNVNDMALYTLPDYQPFAVGEFHQSWLFGISWINDFMLCTGEIYHTNLSRGGGHMKCFYQHFWGNGYGNMEIDGHISRIID